MTTLRTLPVWHWLVIVTLFLPGLTGCSIATGDMLTFFPHRETLLPAAADARKAALAVSPLAVPRELAKSVTEPFRVEPGDGLLIQPAELDSPVILPADQVVLPDGTINLGRYGQLIVAGKTIGEIQSIVQQVVNEYHKKDVGPITVRLVSPQSMVYYVLGEVNTPGSFPLQGRETVLDGIMAAGGLNGRASRSKIILSRPSPPEGCRIILPVCYNEIVQLGDTTTNYQLLPGDRIYVASRTFFESLFAARPKGCNITPHVPCFGQSAGQCAPCGESD